MKNPNFELLREHIDHNIVCVGYGKEELVNVAIECEDCSTVLHDEEKEIQE